MTSAAIISLVVSCISGVVGITALITFLSSRKQKHIDDGAKEAVISANLDMIKLQNESIIQGNRNIVEKLDGQNVRLSRLEQIIEDAHLSEIPPQIAAIEASVKSAHHRIDALERK